MPRTKEEKKKARRKIKQKERRERPFKTHLREKTESLFYKALWFKDKGQFVKALFYLEKVLRLDPKNEECLQEIGHLGYLMKRSDIELNALLGLYNLSKNLWQMGSLPLWRTTNLHCRDIKSVLKKHLKVLSVLIV